MNFEYFAALVSNATDPVILVEGRRSIPETSARSASDGLTARRAIPARPGFSTAGHLAELAVPKLPPRDGSV